MTDAAFLNIGLMLFVACVVAIAARRAGVPYAIALVAAGLGLGAAGLGEPIPFSRTLMFSVLLPPLVFEGSLHLGWQQFRREAPLLLTMALGGTALAAGLVAWGMHTWVGWGWPAAALFGALIAATDPVSVLAMMKEQGAAPRLKFLMEAESLVNDGAAAVLFACALAWSAGGMAQPGEALSALVQIAGGGVLCGLVVAGALLMFAGPSQDPLVETTLTVLAAWGSFLIAERFHASGVLATVAAGMLVGNWGRGRWLSEHGADSMMRIWDMAAFLANSMVFLLIGSRIAALPLAAAWRPGAIAVGLVLLSRVVAVYPAAALFDRGALALDPAVKRIMVWGGLRGALALALALGVPTSLPEHDALILAAFAVVAFSIVVQGLTVPLMLRRQARAAA